ncbi:MULTISPECIES: ABC transporter ATP-binding protein [Clostridium]|uniref:Glycerol-3-phosphate ABC transporter ATP-binding protein n=1 Tax=Clostridium butyricum TaxID=1492 RepID=A0A0A6PZN0_CLOBU|nr:MULTISPECIES: ABC transporter ATP-binding protein [Clostridium]KHD16390.1 glycerol-3-phosphate ABC transporter ATP-binding protein [Clostridium butyricum]KQB79144.1 glycerol-3-phosphate ABC transporter ATP-binding protein [Clostridium butyricum]MBS4840890.1 ABC transporter ATP-binding protein [Clostridium sp.]MDI9210478.1 ABC transporter ATP-binding protein [Clostridium butyricum]MDK2828994.1 multiple sugar transport system ATP-binding protein [Clostridium butyricum]
MAGISLRHIVKTYPGNVTVVPDLNLEIKDKEFVVLVGPSGCGKSTTLRMIAGLEDISGGEMYIGERLVNEIAPKERDISMVFQNYALYPHMTVYKNLAFGLELAKEDKKVIDQKIKKVAKDLDIEYLLNRKPKALSGGQRQRVAVGRSMVRNPSVFLFDEPLSNLDAKLRGEMRAVIKQLHEKLQTTFVYVTHDQVEAMTMADRIVVMKDGYIQQNDIPQRLFDCPCNKFVAGFIGMPQMNFFDCELKKKDDEFYLKFANYEILLPESKNQNGCLDGYVGKTISAGIRPNDLSIVDKEYTINGEVELKELMGAESYIYVNSNDVRFTVRTVGSYKCEIGQGVSIKFDTEKIHLFDKETTKTITN